MKSETTPQFEVHCKLGPRQYTEKFSSKEMAAAFAKAVVNGEALRWDSPEEATAKGGVLIVKSKGLEDLIDMKCAALPEEKQKSVTAFLRGKWPEKKAVKRQQSKKTASKPGLITLAELCTKNKWTPRAARVQLRAMKAKKPGGGWAWPSSEASKVEKKLKEKL